MSELTDDDIRLLRRPLFGFFSAAGGPDPAQPRPVWFEVTDTGLVQLFTGRDTVKVRRLNRAPRASLVVAAPVGERESWVSVAGPVTIESDGAVELARRLAARYWDLGERGRTDDLAELIAEPIVRVAIHPEKVARFVMP